jgi:hypothetical protein
LCTLLQGERRRTARKHYCPGKKRDSVIILTIDKS